MHGEGARDGALRTSTSGAGKEKQSPLEARDNQRGKRGARETSIPRNSGRGNKCRLEPASKPGSATY